MSTVDCTEEYGFSSDFPNLEKVKSNFLSSHPTERLSLSKQQSKEKRGTFLQPHFLNFDASSLTSFMSTKALKIDHLESQEKKKKQRKIFAFELQFPPFGMHNEEKLF